MSIQAGSIINTVRDQIPDPVYSGNTPQPDSDGGTYRAQTLYRYLSDGIQMASNRLNWYVEDWTAMPKQANRAEYIVSNPFISAQEVFVNKWRLSIINEALTIYPNTQITSEQPVWYGVHTQSTQLSVFVFPCPSNSDVTTTLPNSITNSQTSINVASTAGMLNDGYVLIDSELIHYESISGNTLGTITRGVGGTVAATHATNDTVYNCSVWVKGKRGSKQVDFSTDIIELPDAVVYMLQDYVLSRVRDSEQEFQRADQLMGRFTKFLADTAGDPFWQTQNNVPQPAFGSPLVGGLAWGRVIVP